MIERGREGLDLLVTYLDGQSSRFDRASAVVYMDLSIDMCMPCVQPVRVYGMCIDMCIDISMHGHECRHAAVRHEPGVGRLNELSINRCVHMCMVESMAICK